MIRAMQLLILVLLSALAAVAGRQAAHWQVPPESLEQPPPVLPGSTVPMPGATVLSSDPATLRDYHFTLASGGNAGAYLEDARVRRLDPENLDDPRAVRLVEFDSDLARVLLPDSSTPLWTRAQDLIQAHQNQRPPHVSTP